MLHSNFFTKISVIAAGSISTLLGLIVLIGWYSDSVALVQVLPAFVPMQYNTALGFLLSGLGLLSLSYNRQMGAEIPVEMMTFWYQVPLVTLGESAPYAQSFLRKTKVRTKKNA